MTELYRYAAFISYSSKDAAFARKLHRALESYGIPSQLGKFDLIGGGGKKNRIYPVFRDREELSAGHLGDQIEANLKASAALIVVCSPNGAASPWVQKEIEFFAAQGRHAKIFAIIPDTAPLVDEQGADCTQACFPPAFRGDALAGDKLEPLAADARKGKDGFRNAWLKIVAGMIGVSPGQIIDRDKKRRRVLGGIAAGSGATLAALLVTLGWVSLIASERAATIANRTAELEQRQSELTQRGRQLAGAQISLTADQIARLNQQTVQRAAEGALFESRLMALMLMRIQFWSGQSTLATAMFDTQRLLASYSCAGPCRAWSLAADGGSIAFSDDNGLHFRTLSSRSSRDWPTLIADRVALNQTGTHIAVLSASRLQVLTLAEEPRVISDLHGSLQPTTLSIDDGELILQGVGTQAASTVAFAVRDGTRLFTRDEPILRRNGTCAFARCYWPAGGTLFIEFDREGARRSLLDTRDGLRLPLDRQVGTPQLMYARNGEVVLDGDTDTEVVLANIPSTTSRRIAVREVSSIDQFSVQLSRDRRLAFSRSTTATPGIEIINESGRVLRQIPYTGQLLSASSTFGVFLGGNERQPDRLDVIAASSRPCESELRNTRGARATWSNAGLFIQGADGSVRRLDLTNCTMTALPAQIDRAAAWVASDDGRFIATMRGTRVRLYEVRTGALVSERTFVADDGRREHRLYFIGSDHVCAQTTDGCYYFSVDELRTVTLEDTPDLWPRTLAVFGRGGQHTVAALDVDQGAVRLNARGRAEWTFENRDVADASMNEALTFLAITFNGTRPIELYNVTSLTRPNERLVEDLCRALRAGGSDTTPEAAAEFFPQGDRPAWPAGLDLCP